MHDFACTVRLSRCKCRQKTARTCAKGTVHATTMTMIDPMKKNVHHCWIARLLIAIVIGWNLECALVFLINPERYAPGFELAGLPGEAAVRGIAVLFVMWCVPYALALWDPTRHRVSLYEALAMQAVGVLGESLIFFSLPAGHEILGQSILKFLAFDGMGVVLLLGALFCSKRVKLPGCQRL